MKTPPKPRAGRSRADLLHALAAFGSEGVRAIAPHLGFEKKQTEPKAAKLSERPSATKDKRENETDVVDDKARITGTRFEPWRMVSFEPVEAGTFPGEPDWFRKASAPDDGELAADYSKPIPAQPPLLPWSQLWPYLRGAFGAWRFSGNVQVRPLLNAMVSGFWPRTVPRRRRLVWAGTCYLILDFSARLQPFREDCLNLLEKLKKMRGNVGLKVWITEDGTWQKMRPFGQDHYMRFKLPTPGSAVVVLSDLGQYQAEPTTMNAWARFGLHLRAAGCLPVALAPCPRYHWHGRLATIWRLACWDQGQRLPVMTKNGVAGVSPTFVRPQMPTLSRDRLAALLAPAIRVEPGLLRAARQLLPLREADAGSEYHYWNHPKVTAYKTAACMDPEKRAYYQNHFAAFGKATCLKLLDLIGIHHAWLSQAIRLEELATGFRLLGKEHAIAEQFFQRLSRRVTQAKNSLGTYVVRLAKRQTPRDWQASAGVSLAYVMHHKRALKEGKALIPPGLDLRKYLWALGLDGPEMRRELRCFGQQLTLEQGGEARHVMATWRSGSKLGHITARGDFLSFGSNGQANPQGQSLSLVRSLAVAGRKELTLLTTMGEWRLETMAATAKPPWAVAMGCDGLGLFAELPAGAATRKVRWLPPGRFPVLDREGRTVGTWIRRGGCWMADDQFAPWAEGHFSQPDWADQVGVDEAGVYAEVVIAGVSQRLRWIFPGTFLMGSPQGEPGRFKGEVQHAVTLTRGFWLADTACTQALWKAVTGKKPSQFKGQERPVENVSWQDCVSFIAQVNAARPGLELRLPTEAEWEFACRAGTTTAFHFGPSMTSDQVNYDGNNPLEGSPRGASRGKTVPVKALPANGWGLFQMHGNVYEWCSDWLEDYSGEAQVDPSGPDSDRNCVLRGGSCINYGSYCRSAYRYWFDPGDRDSFAGFRLARGQMGKEHTQGPTGGGDRRLSGTGEER